MVAAVETDCREPFIEVLARFPHKRLTLQILITAGGLTDTQDQRVQHPVAGHSVGPRTVQAAERA
jgi:hypothetical protein